MEKPSSQLFDPVAMASLAFLAVLVYLACLLVRFGRNLQRAKKADPTPQAVLVLGGEVERELEAARFMQQPENAKLHMWVSSGHLQPYNEVWTPIADRMHVDWRGVCTVTNFSTLQQDISQHGVNHIYIITSQYHMRRAEWVAFCIMTLGAGIRVTPHAINDPVYVPEHTKRRETNFRVARDVLRCFVWLLMGVKFSVVLRHLLPERWGRSVNYQKENRERRDREAEQALAAQPSPTPSAASSQH